VTSAGLSSCASYSIGHNIGFERDKAYATAAEARIAAVEPLPEATLAPFEAFDDESRRD
jgi:modification methylase